MEDGFKDYEGEERLLAAAQNIVKLLGTHRHATDRLRKLLAEVDAELAAMKLVGEDSAKEFSYIRERLHLAEEKIKSWILDRAMTWDSCPDLFADYLGSVDEVCRLAERAASLSSVGKSEIDELGRLAEDVLQIAMTRIEEELRDILAHGLQSCASYLPSPCCEEEVADKGSVISDESLLGSSRRGSSSTDSDRYVADLVPPDSIPVIKSIAHVMFSAKYDKEFRDAFVMSQKEALDGALVDLGIKRFTIEELIRMEWGSLAGEIKTWIQAVMNYVQVYLAGEKWLCDQIFEELGPLDPAIFADIVNPTMSCLLNFGLGVAIGARRPEKLFYLIDMFDVLRKLSKGMYELFNEEAAASMKVELEELMTRLGCSAKATFLEFGDFILSDPSHEPFPAGQIHHLTKYVMNYINTLPVYKNTLNLLLCDPNGSDIGNGIIQEESFADELDDLTSCPMAIHLNSIVDKLETNLVTKSQLYKSTSLRHIFLINNTHYIVRKVKNSDVRAYLGDEWIRKRIASYQHEATCYVRSSWSWIVPLLKVEGGSDSSSSRRMPLKEKLRSFYSGFEEVYKVQTGWCIKDEQLKEELRISISQRIIPAYQNFVTKCRNDNHHHNLEKHVKYEADELVELIHDLFEGSVKSLNSTWRR